MTAESGRRRAWLPLMLAMVSLSVAVPGTVLARPATTSPPRVPSSGEIFKTIKQLTSHGYRRTGTPAGRRAADFVAGRMRAAGLADVHQELTPSALWTATTSGLTVSGAAVDSFPVAHSFADHVHTGPFSTEPGGRSAALVDVGDGTEAEVGVQDLQGKIALFNLRFLSVPLSVFLGASSFSYDPGGTLKPTDTLTQPFLSNFTDVIPRLQAAGAVGFVGVLSDYFDSNRYFNENYRRTDVPMPGLWVTRSAGDGIRARMAAGGAAGTTATITLAGSRTAVVARTVMGVLPGRSRDTILITSHHDSVFTGAVEDGSGTAEVLALARGFATVPRQQRAKTLMFVTFDSHFTGYAAHQAFVAKYVEKDFKGRHVVAAVTLEHIARQAAVRDGKLVMTGLSEPRGVFQNVTKRLQRSLARTIKANRLTRTAVLPANLFGNVANSLPTDASFIWSAGVPVMSLISGPIYLYDIADTVDKVDRAALAPVARTFATMVERLAATPSDKILLPGSVPPPAVP